MDRQSPLGDGPPPKRQRVLACQKQKCDEQRPCSNCQKSGDECLPTEPAPRHVDPDYVRALEERIAEFESRVDHASPPPMTPMNRHGRSIAPPDADARTQPSSTIAVVGDSRPRNGPHPHVSVHANHIASGEERRTSVATDVSHPSRRPASFHSPAKSIGGESESAAEYLLLGLGPSSIHNDIPNCLGSEASLLANNSPSNASHVSQPFARSHLPADIEELLLRTYRERAQAQYPFLHWGTFLTWHAEWKASSPSEPPQKPWQGFFVNLVYATALLLLSWPRIGALDAPVFYENAMGLFKCVLDDLKPILGAQAHLLLGVHALHSSSTQRLLSLTSAAMRYCVQQLFHLAEDEPEPVDPATRLDNQLRRRCFWSAYGMDRTVMASFGIPHCIPDSMISARLYANIDDEDLLTIAEQTPADQELPDSPNYTCVSSSLHILQCRRIQSEISQYTLSWDYPIHYKDSLDWRVRILAELENYKNRAQSFSDPQAKGHTSQRWLAMIYHYALLMLYRPTKESVLGPAGDWSIQASSQACLIFRKSQMDRQTAQSWMGVLVQFQSGVTLLYCFWATPPEFRTDNYDSPDVSDALRACSNILALMADRWPKAECLRDVFELLAREVPLIDRPNRPPARISDSSAAVIKQNLSQVRALVVHRSILRMIEEMVTEDFPRVGSVNAPGRRSAALPPDSALSGHERVAPFTARTSAVDAPVSSGFELPFFSQQMYSIEGQGVDMPTLSEDELLAFPGMFNLDEWA
ncbi:hypothetical protein ACJ41O_013239 [Fusarium nematophilum]